MRIPEDMAQQGRSHDDLLAFFEHRALIGSQVRFALAAVDDQHLAGLPGRRAQFHVRGKGRSAEADDTAQADLFKDCLSIRRDVRHQVGGKVDALHPLVPLDGDLHAGSRLSGEVLADTDRLDGTGNGGMDECGNESAGFGDHLAGLHFVAGGDDRLGRCADMLREGNVYGGRKRNRLDCSVPGEFRVVRMDAADGKCSSCHA